MCKSCGTALKPAGSDPAANAELELARGAGGWFGFNAVISACLNLLSKNPQTGQLAHVVDEARRNYVLPAGIPERWSTKLGQECAKRSSRPEKCSPQLSRTNTRTRKPWPGRGAPQDPAGTFCSFPFLLPSRHRCLRRAGGGACSSRQATRTAAVTWQWARSTAWPSHCPRTLTRPLATVPRT